MSTHIPARVNAGTPDGGQFATEGRAEADVSLDRTTRRFDVRMEAQTARLDTVAVDPLPPWPADLPAPEVSYSWDSDDALEVSIDLPDGDSVTFWGTGSNISNSLEELPDEGPDLTGAQKNQVMAYGETLHRNLGYVTGTYTLAAHTPHAREAMVAIASGGEPPAPSYPDYAAAPRAAGLEAFERVLDILNDRETIDPKVLAALTPERITELYESYLAPAIDRIETDILEETS